MHAISNAYKPFVEIVDEYEQHSTQSTDSRKAYLVLTQDNHTREVYGKIVRLNLVARLLRRLGFAYRATHYAHIHQTLGLPPPTVQPSLQMLYPRNEKMIQAYQKLRRAWLLAKNIDCDGLAVHYTATAPNIIALVMRHDIISEPSTPSRSSSRTPSRTPVIGSSLLDTRTPLPSMWQNTDSWNSSVAIRTSQESLVEQENHVENRYLIDTQFQVDIGGRQHPCALFAIFAGHGHVADSDNAAVLHLQQHLQSMLRLSLQKCQGADDRSIYMALQQTCLDLNKQLRERNADQAEQITIRRLNADNQLQNVVEGLFEVQGCTANIHLLINNYLWNASIGDNVSLLINTESKLLQLNKPAIFYPSHEDQATQNPCNEELEKRGGCAYLNANGVVEVQTRNGACIQMARTFGSFAAYGATALPEIHRVPMEGACQLIIGTHGFWKAMTPDNVYEQLQSLPAAGETRADQLLRIACEQNPDENMALIYIERSPFTNDESFDNLDTPSTM